MKQSPESKGSAKFCLAAVLGGMWLAFVVAVHCGWTWTRVARNASRFEVPVLTVNPPLRRLSQDSNVSKAATDSGQSVLFRRRPDGNNPLQARDNGYDVIAALQRNGSFEPAANYALAERSDYRRDLIIAAFHVWGRSQPDRAMTTVLQISDTAARQIAFQSVLSGWARTAPEEMAEASLRFPEGVEKRTALTKALRAWMVKDPEAAGDWILTHESAIPVAEELFRKDER